VTGYKTKPKVVIIGGGATGCGVGRDLALRGFDVTLVEFGDLGSGTSSRFHGMLQSGARYVVSDTKYAAECMAERRIIANLVPDAVEKTGGLFVSLSSDSAEYADRFFVQCKQAGIPSKELDPEQVMAEEPAISRDIHRVFSVPDATIHSWRLVNLLADDIRHYSGTVLMRHKVTRIDVQNGQIKGVEVAGPSSNIYLPADIVVNAAGPWAGRVASLVGEETHLQLGKGSILVFSHRITSRAINRCRPPTSHDIIVPTGTISLFGTTSEIVEDPDTTHVRPEEIQQLLSNAEEMIPNARSYRAFRAWAGVRPLYRPLGWDADTPLPRRHSIIEHARNGIDGFFTICGGSLTTHRSMAEDLGNRVCASLDITVACTTATTPLARHRMPADWHPAQTYYRVENARCHATQVCECESIEQADVAALIKDRGIRHLHDLRRRLRIGFGPCQGIFCGPRVAAMIANESPGYPATTDLGKFWSERLKGSRHSAWGSQAKQILLSDLVYCQTLGLRLTPEILPKEERR
jgi:glycerol-3-phosphate dehydrogenase